LTQEVAYNSLLLKRRKELHEKIGRAIEEIYLERLEEFYEMLAYHYFEGEIWSKALDYLTKAADKAAAAYANQEALGYYARALEVCDKLGTPALKACVNLARKRGVVNCTIGDYREAIEDFDRMRAAACKIADRHLEGTALAYRGFAEHQNHMVGTPEDTLRAALAIADEGFEDVRFRANACLGGHFLVYNRHSEALPLLREASELAHKVDDALIQGWWVLFESLMPNWQGRFEDALKVQAKWHNATRRGRVSFLVNTFVEALARGGKGEYEQAMACLNEILTIGERMGEVARALNTMGWLYSELQDHHRAMTWNTQGINVARKANFSIPEAESNARLNLGDNLLALGRLDEAEAEFEHVEQIVHHPRPQDHFMLWRYSQHLLHSYGELWLIRGDVDKAMAYAEECVSLAEQSHSQKNIVKGRRLRGQVFIAQRMVAEAEQELSSALEVALRVGNPTQLWVTHSALARMYESMKNQELEREHWKAAAAIIESTAGGLQDKSLRKTFINAAPVREIIEHASRFRGNNEQATFDPQRVSE
jgi:tetratricopeptide (TPR) repeat protein